MSNVRRGTYHFTVPDHWMNDPQRPVEIDGTYHFYYLYNADYPNGTGTAWRLATTTDNLHFEDAGIAIPKHTQPNGDIWSGSAVVDTDNTAGFGAGAVIALATQPDHSADGAQAQFLWYSTDGGRTFSNDGTEPVLPNPGVVDFRDPKIVRDPTDGQWICVLAEGYELGFYSSSDLKSWQPTSRFAEQRFGILECPDLFRLRADDGTDHWVLGASADGRASGLPNTYAYWVGTYHRGRFEATSPDPQWLDYGPDWYAAVTWASADDGTEESDVRFALGWMNNWAYANSTPTWPDLGFNGTDSIVREIRLKRRPAGRYTLVSQPVSTLEAAATEVVELPAAKVEGIHPLDFRGSAYELNVKITWDDEPNAEIHLCRSADGTRYVSVGVRDGQLSVDRSHTTEPSDGKLVRTSTPLSGDTVCLRILVDHTTLEVFVDDGDHVHSHQIFPTEDENHIALLSTDNPTLFSDIKIRRL